MSVPQHRIIKIIGLAAIVVVAACGTKATEGDSVVVPVAELGQACTASTDCVGGLLCMTTPGGRVCVESCQAASECSQVGALCTPVPGVDVGWCDTAQGNLGETPVDETPMDEMPMDEMPIDEMPIDETPIDEMPMEEPPVEDPNVRSSYPEGPFGTMVGEVMENHSMVDPDGQPMTLSDLRADASVKIILIFSTVTYCRGCQAKTAELTALQNELGEQGLLPVVTLYENNDYAPASAPDALRYKNMLNLTFPVIADGADVFQRYFAERGHPMILVLNAEDMTILYKRVHWRRDDVEAVIREHL